MIGYGTSMGGFGFGGMIFMMIFWVAFIWLIVWLILQLGNKNQSENRKKIGKEKHTKN